MTKLDFGSGDDAFFPLRLVERVVHDSYMRLIIFVDGSLLRKMEDDNELSDITVHSANSTAPDKSDLYQTELKNGHYSDHEPHHNKTFTPEFSTDQNGSEETNQSKNSAKDCIKQQNSRQCFERFLNVKITEKQCSGKAFQTIGRTEIKTHETCVTVKRKRKRTLINRLSGMELGKWNSNCSLPPSIPLNKIISHIPLNLGSTIIRFLDRISTDPISTNIPDINHSSSNLSNSGTVKVSVRVHSKTEPKELTDNIISNDIPCHIQTRLGDIINRGDFSTAREFIIRRNM